MSQEPSTELLGQLRRERTLIAEELPELGQRHDRMVEAQGEDTFSGHLRRALHRSGRLVRDLAAEAGVSSQVLCEFLEGTRTLRSDVLDRLAQAVHARISVEWHQHRKGSRTWVGELGGRWAAMIEPTEQVDA
jgi:transcriptional regulator with XRE-family HTH domain